ncbi:MAG: hypothetical protein H6700_02930 [Myxococcales bacterium]|nr:hypothetical protein [Myxococcales bacterium]MCB9530695.1 hypothetical protein [Myxococcales bacterium]
MKHARSPLALAAAAALAGAACDLSSVTQVLNGDCASYDSAYQVEIAQSGELAAAIPATPDGFAMGVVLNQRAVNELFRRLGDTELPVLRQSFRLLGQSVTVALQPSIPTLAIGGDTRCPSCFAAAVPFAVGVGFTEDPPQLGGGTLSAQMPLGLVPVEGAQTAFVASFQELDVTGLQLDVNNATFNTALSTIEPIVNALLSQWLRSRFENARIATFDTWALGQGSVKLAGRGPFVYPETETIVVAMQSNLKVADGPSMTMQTQLPNGADVGFIFDPRLLLSMTRRMNYESVIPSEFDATGQQAVSGGGTKVTFQTLASGDDGLLRAGATLYRTDNLCGTANLSAAMGLTVEPGVFAFSIRDVQVTSGEGVGRLLSQDAWGTGPLVNALLDTLQFTVNYDQMFAGERGESPEMGTFQANIDARGVSVFFNIADL